MNVLFVGDPHLKITRFQLAKQFLAWLDDTVRVTKPDLVVILGDTFDTHAVVRSEVMSEFMTSVYRIVDANIPCVYVVGNHDLFKPNDTTYNALSHLVNRVTNLYIVDKVTELFDMTFVPYIHNPSLFPRETKQICIAHQTFKGADYGDITTQEGVDPNLISAEIIISGHIHKKQVLGKVIYPGSPFSQGISDINQTKGLIMLDTASLKEKFIPCPLPMWRGDKFIVEQGFTVDDVHEYIVANVTGSKDHWVIDLTGTRAEIYGYISSSNYKKAIDGVDIKVKTTYTDKEKRQVRIESLSAEDIISQYIVKVYSGSLDKTILTQKAIELLKS